MGPADMFDIYAYLIEFAREAPAGEGACGLLTCIYEDGYLFDVY